MNKVTELELILEKLRTLESRMIGMEKALDSILARTEEQLRKADLIWPNHP